MNLLKNIFDDPLRKAKKIKSEFKTKSFLRQSDFEKSSRSLNE